MNFSQCVVWIIRSNTDTISEAERDRYLKTWPSETKTICMTKYHYAQFIRYTKRRLMQSYLTSYLHEGYNFNCFREVMIQLCGHYGGYSLRCC